MAILRRPWAVGRGRWWRPLWLMAAGYVALAILSNVVIFGAVAGAKLFGRDTRLHDPSLPRHFRKADDRVWVGAQGTRDHYRRLAAMGVTLVVDLVPGQGDDPAFLRDLGIDHLWLPLSDGRAPDADTVRRFLEAVESSRGAVYAHCGAGVGRSSSLAAAYVAAAGKDPSLVEALAVGPPTIEQAWFIWASEPGHPAGGNGWVAALSRFLDAPRKGFDFLKNLI